MVYTRLQEKKHHLVEIYNSVGGSGEGLSLLIVYVGVVECASAFPTHTPPPHTGCQMSAHLSRLRLFQRHLRSGFGFGSGFGTLLLTHSFRRSPSSRQPPFTQYPFPSCSLVRDGQICPHMPRLVVPHSTCPSLSPSPPRTQLCNRGREGGRERLGTIHNGGSRAAPAHGLRITDCQAAGCE